MMPIAGMSECISFAIKTEREGSASFQLANYGSASRKLGYGWDIAAVSLAARDGAKRRSVSQFRSFDAEILHQNLRLPDE